jgi:hypothetical protein
MAFSPAFSGGVFVAGADVNGDGLADVIVGSGIRVSPLVNVFSGANGGLLSSFPVYYPGFVNGVHVGGVRDLNGDGLADILTAGGFPGTPGASGLFAEVPEGSVSSPVGAVGVQAIDGMSLALLDNFFAYAPSYFGGIWVAGSR